MTSEMTLDQMLVGAEYARDPHPGNHRLRHEDPIYWSTAWGAWVPTRHADIKAILSNYETFSSKDVNRPRLRRLLASVPEPEREQMLSFWAFEGLFQSDPPSYRRIRSVVMKALLPRLDRLPAQVEKLVDQMIDRFIEHGEVDLISEFAFDLPATVIFDLMDLPPDDRLNVRRWADTIIGAISDQSGTTARAATDSLRDGYAWLAELVPARQRGDADDLISGIVRSEEFGSMTEADVLSTFVFMLVAGHETTANLIGNAMFHLVTHPDDMVRFREDPASIGPGLEEILRHESPIQTTARVVTQDVQFGDAEMKAGQVVTIMHGAANRDPSAFPDPDKCDIRRDAAAHLAFGQGVHFCVGAPLARMEGPIAVRRLLQRLTNLELAGDAPWRENITFRGLERLPLRFEPGRLAAS